MEVDPHQLHQSKKSAVFDFQEAFLLHSTCGILVDLWLLRSVHLQKATISKHVLENCRLIELREGICLSGSGN